jgi:CRISPR type III-A-associated RAMP protein Csm4
MNPGFIVRLRPAGPWRIGPASGARNVVDHIYHSDSLYSAITSAIAQLDSLEEWIAATASAEGEPAVRFSSLFPYQREMLFVPPPRNAWPPAGTGKVRWQGARFIPAGLVARLLADNHLDEDRWAVDGATGCLLNADRGQPGPFRTSVRTVAAVDRITGEAIPHSTACLEFSSDAGLWCAVAFSGDAARRRWSTPVKGAFRLLADSGFGGERSRGWGRAEAPSINEGRLPGLILEMKPSEGEERGWWMLSLFSPSEHDRVDWTRGNYAVVARSGRVESRAGWGVPKRTSRVVTEGSVVISPAPPRGAAVDAAPEGFPHPVYRYGFALAISIPLKGAHRPAAVPPAVAARVPVEKKEREEVAAPPAEPVVAGLAETGEVAELAVAPAPVPEAAGPVVEPVPEPVPAEVAEPEAATEPAIEPKPAIEPEPAREPEPAETVQPSPNPTEPDSPGGEL